MYKGNRVAVVVPAYNEELFIEKVLKNIPEFVDRVFVVDDASSDNTGKIVALMAFGNRKVKVVNLLINSGVGNAVALGHGLAIKENIDILAVMAGDDQMDPQNLKFLLEPITTGMADYTKGDRVSLREHTAGMPGFRRFGTRLLTILTRISSGNWSIRDPQNGYTAINYRALKKLELTPLYEGYGYCNDILVKLSAFKFNILNVPMPARYGTERSGIKYHYYIPRVSWLLVKLYFWRLRLESQA